MLYLLYEHYTCIVIKYDTLYILGLSFLSSLGLINIPAYMYILAFYRQ